jgi:hypothetical protein
MRLPFALLDLFALLPVGNLDSSGIIGAVAIQTLVVSRLWHGSWIAWLAAMCYAGVGILMILVLQPPLEVGVILVLVVLIAQFAILCTHPITPLARGAAQGRPA